jgi:hypothetical protein
MIPANTSFEQERFGGLCVCDITRFPEFRGPAFSSLQQPMLRQYRAATAAPGSAHRFPLEPSQPGRPGVRSVGENGARSRASAKAVKTQCSSTISA